MFCFSTVEDTIRNVHNKESKLGCLQKWTFQSMKNINNRKIEVYLNTFQQETWV